MNLTPLGTVRRRLGAPEPRAAPFPQWLVDGARERGLDEAMVYMAWELARAETNRTPREHEALVTLVVLTMVALQEGSTRLPRKRLDARFVDLGAEAEHYDAAKRLIEGGSEILGQPGDYKPLIVAGDYIYHQRIHRQEHELAERLSARLKVKPQYHEYADVLDALDRVLGHRAAIGGRQIQLSAGQQQAIRTAATRPLTLISGGPGTGKTSVVISLLRVLARLEVPMGSVALAAPTGKAARRLDESIQAGLGAVAEPKIIDAAIAAPLAEPKTLHRLLGYSPRTRRFRYDERHPLPARVVIIDEASMIDLDLMHRLMRAIRPETRLVLLGDANQLPPVGAGAVFRDIARAGGSQATVELRDSYRMDPKDSAGRNLWLVSQNIHAGEAPSLIGPSSKPEDSVSIRESAEQVLFRGAELMEGERDAFLDRWMRERVMTPRFRTLVERNDPDGETLATIEAHLGSHRILCVTNADVARINGFFQRAQSSRLGEPVMMLRNDHERGLFNGDSGVSLRSGIVFKGRSFDPVLLERDLAPAYAVSVHKSQGSEYDHVALVLPKPDHPLLTRELLYTAMTRARKSVTILGSRDALAAGISRIVERSTGILEQLA